MNDTEVDRLVLRPGCHLFRRSDGQWRLYGPGDRFARIIGPDDTLAEVERLLSIPAPRPSRTSRTDVGPLLVALDQREVLEPWADTAVTGAGPPPTVHVVVGDDVGRAVANLLAPHVPVTTSPPGTDVTAADVLVWCADRLPDAAWLATAEACGQLSRPWHMSYPEGGRYIVGPFSVPGRTASYVDARSRRLAAAPSPDDLRELWGHLDRSSPAVPALVPPAAALLVAGILAADILEFFRTGAISSGGDQLEIDVQRLSVTHHPVLPVPRRATPAEHP